MEEFDIFVDPTILFDLRSLSSLRDAAEERGHFYTSGQMAPWNLAEMPSQEFRLMQRKFGSWLPPRRIPSRSRLAEFVEGSNLSFFSWQEHRDEMTDAPFDPQMMERLYRLGWEHRIDIDGIWFLVTHSTILARIKARERGLLQIVREILHRGNRSAHLTIEDAPGGFADPEYATIRGVGRWAIWLLYGAALAGQIQPWIPWAIAGGWEALLVSVRV